MAEAGDGALWASALAGDERAFTTLFDRHYPSLYRHVLRICPQHADADEVTAATFLTMWRLRSRVGVVNDSVLPWLLVTAGNLARNEGRRMQRYRRLLDRMPRDAAAAGAAEIVADRDLAVRRSTALAAGLRRLSTKDARLVELTAINDVPIVDAAVLLGLTSGAARVRLHRARLRLRDLIDLPDTLMLRGEVS